MKWDVLGVFHMALKLLIRKKLRFRETGKNTEKPNGKPKSKCRKTELLRWERLYRFESCFRTFGMA